MITLRKLQLFFQRIGYKWNGEILNKEGSSFVKAKSFDDVNKPNSDITIFRLYKGKKIGDVAMSVSEVEMKHYTIKAISKIGKIYNLQNDLSKQWRAFLKEKEKQTGIDFEFISKQDWKDFVDRISCYIPNSFNKTKYSINVNTRIPQNASIQMDEINGDATWCIDLTEESISLYVKKNDQTRKMTSKCIEEEWRKFMALTSDKIFATIETDK